MRSILVTGRCLGAAALVTLTVVPSADASTMSASGSRTTFDRWCVPADTGLTELSGLHWSGETGYAIGDHGSDDRLAVLDRRCEVTKWIEVGTETVDVEDLARSDDGTLWSADTGDNDTDRNTAALIGLDLTTGEHTRLPITFVDGPHDVEAFALTPSGKPVLVTKVDDGAATVYTTAGNTTVDSMATDTATALVAAGTVPATAADGKIRPITGAAVSTDGTLAALRTKKDVFVYRVDDGDVTAAFIAAPVLVLEAPEQPQGEAVAFTDDDALLVASEADGGPLPPIQALPGISDLVRAAEQPSEIHVPAWALLTGPLVVAAGAGVWWMRRRS